MKKLGLIFVVFLSLGVFFVPNKIFAGVATDAATTVATSNKGLVISATGPLTPADVARWKGYADVSFGNPAYAMYREVFYKLADEVFLKYPQISAKQGFQYILAEGPAMDPVRYGSARISGMLQLAESEQSSNGNDVTAPARLRAGDVISALLTYQEIENTVIDKSNGTITETQAKEKIDNAVANHQKSVEATNKSFVEDCKTLDVWCHVQKSLVNIIKIFLLNIAGFLLWASANMLNYSIKVGILDFARWAPDTLYPIWIVVRQIVSLFVVFAGLYLGLMYIIGKDEKFEKYIPWVVIFALFVNFSYPLARTAIDVSNIVSLNIYTGAVGESVLTGEQKNTAGAIIMQRLGLEKLVLSATENKASTDMVTGISSPAGALMVIVFVLFSAYIFFMVTWLIIARTAVLIFLTIASPILFIDSVIPKLGDVAMTLRKTFLEQLFVGPVFMIMLALTLKFLEVFNLSKTSSSGSGTFDTTIVEFFNITMMLIMLHIMRKVTMSTAGGIGATVSGYMGKVGGFAVGGAAGLAMGGAGFLARQTIGRHASKLANSDWMNTQAGKTGVGGFVGRRMMGMTESIAKSSFDARNSSYVQAGGAKLGLSGGMGTGTKMSFDQVEEQRKKNLEKHFSRVGTYKDNQYRRDESGNLVLEKKKGEVINSDEAREARKEYIKNATGSSIFTTEQERLDTEHKLQKSDGKINQTDEEKEKEKKAIAQAQIDSTKALAEALAESNKQFAETMSSKQTTTPPQATAPQTEKPPVTDFATMFTS